VTRSQGVEAMARPFRGQRQGHDISILKVSWRSRTVLEHPIPDCLHTIR